MLKNLFGSATKQPEHPVKPAPEQPQPRRASKHLKQHLLSLTKDAFAIHERVATQEAGLRGLRKELVAEDARSKACLKQDAPALQGTLAHALSSYPGEAEGYLPADHEQLRGLKEDMITTAQLAEASSRRHAAYLADLQHLGQHLDTTLQKVVSSRNLLQESAHAAKQESSERRRARMEQLQQRLAIKRVRRQLAAGDVAAAAATASNVVLMHRATDSSSRQLAGAAASTSATSSSSSSLAGHAVAAHAAHASKVDCFPTVMVTGSSAPAAAAVAARPQPSAAAAAAAPAHAGHGGTEAAASSSAAGEAQPGTSQAATEAPAVTVPMANAAADTAPTPAEPAAVTAAAEAAVATDATPVPAAATVQVHISISHATQPGQRVYVVGSHPALGSWDTAVAVRMKWHQRHVWKASVEVEAGSGSLEFKAYVVTEVKERVAAGKPLWERGANRTVHVQDQDVHSSHSFKAA